MTAILNFSTDRWKVDPVFCDFFETPFRKEDKWHSHTGFYELAIVLDGSLWNEFPSGKMLLKPGDFIIYAPGSVHHYRNLHTVRYCNILFVPEIFRNVAAISGMKELIAEKNDLQAVHCLGSHNLVTASAIADDIRKELFCKEKGWKESAVALLYRLLIFLLRCSEDHLIENSSGLVFKISRSIQYMEKNFTEPLRLEQLASGVNMSESSYRHNFKNIIGCSPIQYLNRLRLKYAAQLLYLGKNIAEASELAGFNDPGDFRKMFRKYAGLSPSQVLKFRMRGDEQFRKLLTELERW